MSCRPVNVKFLNASGGGVGLYDIVDSDNNLVFEGMHTSELEAGLTFSVSATQSSFKLANFRLGGSKDHGCFEKIQFVGHSNASGSNTSVDGVPVPSGATAGDFAFICSFQWKSTGAPNPAASNPESWTLLYSQTFQGTGGDTGFRYRFEVMYKILEASDIGTSKSLAESSRNVYQMVVFRKSNGIGASASSTSPSNILVDQQIFVGQGVCCGGNPTLQSVNPTGPFEIKTNDRIVSIGFVLSEFTTWNSSNTSLEESEFLSAGYANLGGCMRYSIQNTGPRRVWNMDTTTSIANSTRQGAVGLFVFRL